MNKTNFIKYQSLGNHFILINSKELFPRYELSYFQSQAWKTQVVAWCALNFGIGADGVLLFFDEPAQPRVMVFNADGSDGQFSGNGSRCAAHYFNQLYPNITSFVLEMGGRKLACSINSVTKDITMLLPSGLHQGMRTVIINQESFSGDDCNVGNPHFVVDMSLQADEAEDYKNQQKIKAVLSRVGYDLMTYQGKQHQVNVQFYWKLLTTSDRYGLLSYERGAGMTLACASGAAALVWTLYTKKQIQKKQELMVCMPGGILTVQITDQEEICLTAQAVIVFQGVCEN